MPGLTPEGAGSIKFEESGNGGGYEIRGTPEKYAGRPPPSEQLAGVPGDPSGSTAEPGSASATPTPRGAPNELTGTMRTLDPGPPEQFTRSTPVPLAGDETLPEEYTTTGVEEHRVSGSDPETPGCAAEIEYDQAPTKTYKPPRDPQQHVGDSRFGPGAPSAFNGGTATLIGRPSTPVAARRPATGGPGADPRDVFSSTPKVFDHAGLAKAMRGW
jgi:hypothetical protein